VLGLDDIRSFNWVQKHPTDIYAEKRVQESIKRIFDYVFSEYKYPGIPEMELHLIDESPFEIENIRFTPIRCYHHNLPVLGFRVGDLTYVTDTNFIPAKEMEKIAGSRILIVNALRKEKHLSHFNLEQALDVIENIQPEKAFLTHASHGFGKHSQIQAQLPENVFMGYDGLKIILE
jgi:phosphoribosyl 1,2-cyclic phosphate phosphodiesterase